MHNPSSTAPLLYANQIAAFEKREILEFWREQTTLRSVHECVPYKQNHPWPELAIERFGSPHFRAARCRGRNACIVCTSELMALHRREIDSYVSLVSDLNVPIYWQRLSCAHDEFQTATEKYRILNRTWGDMCRSRGFQGTSNITGNPIWVKVLEETLTWYGWYPHYHVLWLFPPDTKQPEVASFFLEVTKLWVRAAAKNGSPRTTQAAQYSDLEKVNTGSGSMSQYLFKHGFYDLQFNPLVSSPFDAGLSPFEVLRVYLETGDSRLAKFYKQFEFSSKGQHRVRYSREFDETVRKWTR